MTGTKVVATILALFFQQGTKKKRKGNVNKRERGQHGESV
jgi:hypothetical protein